MSNNESEENILKILYPSPRLRAERTLRRYKSSCRQNGTLPDFASEEEEGLWELERQDIFIDCELNKLMNGEAPDEFYSETDLAMAFTKSAFAEMEDDTFILPSDEGKGRPKVRPEIYKEIFSLVYAYYQVFVKENDFLD